MVDNDQKTEGNKSANGNKLPTKRKKTPAQIAKEIEMLERGKRVIQLKKSGASFRAIAERLAEEGTANVTYITVRRDYLEAMRILSNDRNDEALSLKELQNQRLEDQLLAHWVPSTGKTFIEIDPETGKAKEDANGKPKRISVPPDTESGRLVLKIIREISELNDLKPKRTEISGRNGGPIETVTTEITVEDWRENVRKRREEAAKTQSLFEED